MNRGTGTIFLGGPPLVKAATGEIVSAEDLGGAALHCKKSGVTDHFAENDEHALAIARRIVANLNIQKQPPVTVKPVVEPLFDTKELRAMAPVNLTKPFDMVRYVAVYYPEPPWLTLMVRVGVAAQSNCSFSRW
jgi:3-methylcrotonyl-CoA carboxylase beta subunit